MQKQMYNPIWHIPAMFVPDRFLQRSGFRERNPQNTNIHAGRQKNSKFYCHVIQKHVSNYENNLLFGRKNPNIRIPLSITSET